ncbi:unnamed protein product [Linum trigynum]|uniref:DUF8040 domain-containing protein n=1 Tax=Linum trigynum TaxID=586398 RepID=A0AAV2G4T5_9ROSI
MDNETHSLNGDDVPVFYNEGNIDDTEDLISLNRILVLQTWQTIMDYWQRQRKTCEITLICYIVHAPYLLNCLQPAIDGPLGQHESYRARKCREFMDRLTLQDTFCRSTLRMGSHAFAALCEMLRNTGPFVIYKRSTVEEQVAKFLLGHIGGNYTSLCLHYYRSNETVHRHFHNVLRAVLSLVPQLLQQPATTTTVGSKIHEILGFIFIFRIALVLLMDHIFMLRFHVMTNQDFLVGKNGLHKM